MASTSFFTKHRGALIALALLILLPFIIGVFDGDSPVAVWKNESGTSKFLQGLAIEIFILALFALSFDLIFGITGMLSFGHSMFFGVGAYLTGIAIKSFSLSLPATLGWVFVAAIVQAILFGLVLPGLLRRRAANRMPSLHRRAGSRCYRWRLRE